MKYAMGIIIGCITGAVTAPVGALIALGAAATADITAVTLVFSAGGVLAALPLVILVGLVLGGLIGAIAARAFNLR